MPELKDVSRDGWEDADVDVGLTPVFTPSQLFTFFCQQWDAYGYSDSVQEKKRLQDLENRAKVSAENKKNKAERLAKQKANAAWSSQTLKRETRDKRKEKKVKRKQWLKSQQLQPSPSASAVPQKRGLVVDDGDEDEDEDEEDDWAELAREERMAKKAKKGEITQVEFDSEFMHMS